MDPRITVLIGAYNHEATLPRAVASMLAQTVEDLELIVIDDGSSDRSVEVAESLAAGDPRVRVLPMGENVGIARSLNAALREARAPVVAVQDADDWSEPQRLERQLAVLDAEPDVAVVGSRMREVDEAGRELTPRTSFAPGDVGGVLMRFNPIPNTSAALRRSVVLDLGGYDPRYRYAMEYDLWLRVAERQRVVAIDQCGGAGRTRPDRRGDRHPAAGPAAAAHAARCERARAPGSVLPDPAVAQAGAAAASWTGGIATRVAEPRAEDS
jgi:glycosyltransferase involved in cell wall biosynthesis